MHSTRYYCYLSLMLFLLMSMFFLSLCIGEYNLALGDIARVIMANVYSLLGIDAADPVKMHTIIIWNIRLPRLFLACLVGAALSLAGVLYQACFRNPLVEPFILGVSSGAAFGAALAIVFPLIFPQIQLTAFLFALLAVAFAYILGYTKAEGSAVTLVLSGIVVGAFFSALVGIMKYVSEDTQLREITFWMMGGLHHATWHDVSINIMGLLPCAFMGWFWAWKLNILSLGDEEAQSLGIAPHTTRIIFLLLATMTAAIAVSLVGIIAWVGLMIPHATRMILGPDNRLLIPGAMLMGASYMLLCDTFARTLTSAEIPIGIITSIIGSPYLLYLLRHKGAELYG